MADHDDRSAAPEAIEREVKSRFPEGAVETVELLDRSDEFPGVRHGQVAVRVNIISGSQARDARSLLEAFLEDHEPAIVQLARDLPRLLPDAWKLEIADGPHNIYGIAPGAPGLHPGAITPVMARLGPIDLNTLDTLVAAGIAPSRADAIRWALARIRERPAFAQLHERAREIDQLKAQF